MTSKDHFILSDHYILSDITGFVLSFLASRCVASCGHKVHNEQSVSTIERFHSRGQQQS